MQCFSSFFLASTSSESNYTETSVRGQVSLWRSGSHIPYSLIFTFKKNQCIVQPKKVSIPPFLSSIESTALRIITGLGSADVQPQLSRFLAEPNNLLSADSEELNRALVLTLARAMHVTGENYPSPVISHDFCYKSSSASVVFFEWREIATKERSICNSQYCVQTSSFLFVGI